ncbi:MAG: lamin tail domain-containing protein [Myxococcota bacterium]|nr:lamin tail domain-containing protein [Myxococcota bacterium]
MPRLISLLGLVLASSCTEYEFYTQQQTDTFQQNSRNTVDVLLVVDNSCSMIEEQVKLASNFESFIQYFQGVDVDYQIAVVTTDTLDDKFKGRLVGGDDEIIFLDALGREVDRVVYDSDWPFTQGAALSLNPDRLHPSYNDAAGYWCAAQSEYGDGDLGTPGADNPECEEAAPPMADTEVDTGAGTDTGEPADTGPTPPRGPIVGDVVITEFLADPSKVDDVFGEWVELKNVSDETLDFSGCTLKDSGRNEFVVPESTHVAAGDYLVLARSSDPSVNGGVENAVELGEAFTLNDQVFILRPDTAGASEIFAEMVAVGITGSGIEMGLEAARLALTEPLLSTTTAGFVREEANLNIIFLSDEDDNSPLSADVYLRDLTEVKGEAAYRDHNLFKISAVVGSEAPEFPGQPSCSSANGAASYGTRYVHAASRTEGVVESICDEDFSPIAQQLGLVLSGLSLEFELSGRPDENTLKAALYSDADTESFERELIRGEDYVYLSERNAIRFEEDQIPPSQWYVQVKYTLLAVGATQGEEE